jgi:signal transduction histidine kinase
VSAPAPLAAPVPIRARSIFAKVLAIMVVMAVCLLSAVSAFFFLFVNPAVNDVVGRTHVELARTEAALAPDFEAAQGFARRTGIQVAYDGPAGRWSTTPRVTDVHALREQHRHTFVGSREVSLVDMPDGGRYAFLWSFGPRMDHFHTVMLASLLGIMIVVFVAAYWVLQRLLTPIRALSAGVARLGEGHFEPLQVRPSGDEFGALAEAFDRMVERLRAMMQARDQLLLDVSHELRSPLTRLKVALALLPADDQRARMEADVAEMEAMVGELLELERLRDGKGVQRADVDGGALVADVAAAFAGQAPGIAIAPHAAIVASVDGARVRMVVRNLVENAIKYSLPDSAPVQVTLERTREAVVIRVADDGAGIPEAERSRIFLPFYRVDRARSRRTGGYGLGLSICQRIAEAHGGTLAALGRTPRGTDFVVTLPAP